MTKLPDFSSTKADCQPNLSSVNFFRKNLMSTNQKKQEVGDGQMASEGKNEEVKETAKIIKHS